MAPHADLDSGQLLDQPARLPPGADEPRPDLSDAVLRVRKVFDIEDLEVCVLVQETESPILREAAARGWSKGTACPTSITTTRPVHHSRLYSLISAWTSSAFRIARRFVTTSAYTAAGSSSAISRRAGAGRVSSPMYSMTRMLLWT